MEANTKLVNEKNNRIVISIFLSILLALCMFPFSTTQASAKTNHRSYVYERIYKTYVYNYMYGTYNDGYALGFRTYYGLIEQVDVVNAKKGVTISVKNYGVTNPYWLTSWIYGLTQSSVPGVIGKPVKFSKAIKYSPYKLSGEKLSDAKYDKVVYFDSKQIAGGKGTAFFKNYKRKCLIDVYDNYGKKVQSIKAKTKNSESGNIEYQNDKIYLNVQSTWFVLKKGKFIKSKKPASNYSYNNNYPLLQSEMVDNSNGTNGSSSYLRWYLLTKNGKRINLPFNNGASYTQVSDLGVYCIDNKKICRLYNNKGKLLKTIRNAKSIIISESVVPKVFILTKNGKLYGAYNSSFKLITKSKVLVNRYANCWLAGTYKKQKIYAVRLDAKLKKKYLICEFLRKNMRPLKIKHYALVGKMNNTLAAPINLSEEAAHIGMNYRGDLFLINSKGKRLTGMSFTNFDLRENAKYALLANGRKWSFVPLRKS